MRYSLVFIFLLSGGAWATPSRWVDGQIQFAIATVDGKSAWTTQERDAITVGTSVVVALTPSVPELNLSTAMVTGDTIKWRNYSEYLDCQNRVGLIKKFRELKAEFDSANDLNDFKADIRARIRWMIQYYQSLP